MPILGSVTFRALGS